MSASTTTAGAVPGPAKDQRIAKALGRRRHRSNILVKVLCVLATAIGLLLLALGLQRRLDAARERGATHAIAHRAKRIADGDGAGRT